MKKPFLLVLAAVVGVVAYAVVEMAAPVASYAIGELREMRRVKNRRFRLSPDSPLTPDQQQHFDSLKYFLAAPEWSLKCAVSRQVRPDLVTIQMSDNQAEKYLRWGRTTFSMTGQPAQSLTLFQRASGPDSALFVPFTDATNGHQTYGGGRYLDVALPAPGVAEITLDFNRAYNPYCAYNDGYSCPVPPAENRLSMAVPAGEKSFHD